MTALEIVPLSLADARRYVADNHRHNEPPIAHRFSIGLQRDDGTLAGVVIAGRPVARMLNDGRTVELLRLTTEGDKNACSRLYGAACRAAQAMGYRRVVTYTLEEEPGTSLKAAGFRRDGKAGGGDWYRPSQPQRVGGSALITLWGDRKIPTGPKVRWVRELAA